jgi:hypothetical protein
VECLDKGVPPTYVNLAKACGRSRQTIWETCQRHPDIWIWINRQLEDSCPTFVAAVVRRTAMLAMQGSDKHADIYLRYMAGGYARPLPGDGSDAPAGSQFTMNFLIPRPETPVIPGVTVREVQPQLAANVPTVEVR